MSGNPHLQGIDFDAINRAALAACPDLLQQWFPAGRVHGREFHIGNLRGDRGESLRINLDTGLWADFAAGHDAKGRDLVALRAKMLGIPQPEAAREVAEELGMSSTPPNGRANGAVVRKLPAWQPIMPVPENASPPPPQHPKWDAPSHVAEIRDDQGRLLRLIRRFDPPKSRKVILPLTFGSLGGVHGWQWRAPLTPRPLYGLDRLARHPDRSVLLVEGEAKRDAAERMLGDRAVVLSWPNGADGVGKADWRPLQGRDVAVWPDADQAGADAAHGVVDALRGLARSVRIVQLPEGKADGWDLADAEREGWTGDQVWACVSHRVEQQGDGLQHLMAQLARNAQGAVLPTMANLLLILQNDPQMAGLLVADDFFSEVMLTRAPPPVEEGGATLPGPYPRPRCDEDGAMVLAYVQRAWSSRFKKEAVLDAMFAVAAFNRCHPVRDWIASLRWDGKPRLDSWLQRAFGAPDDDYHRAVGAKVLIGAVRRVRQPGCKFDTMMILEGPQNIGKSTAIKRLFGEHWFTDQMPPNLADKDTAQALQGVVHRVRRNRCADPHRDRSHQGVPESLRRSLPPPLRQERWSLPPPERTDRHDQRDRLSPRHHGQPAVLAGRLPLRRRRVDRRGARATLGRGHRPRGRGRGHLARRRKSRRYGTGAAARPIEGRRLDRDGPNLPVR
jgi:putative DNA primase/helicase